MNERMTKRDTDGQAMMDCEKCKADWTGKHGKPMADCTALYCRNRLLDRLVEHEDTGWTPEMLHKLGENAWHLWDFAQAAENMTVGRLKELAEADKDGRVRIMPESQNETCGNCDNFKRESGTRHGLCAKRPHPRNRYGKIDRSRKFIVYQNTQSCKLYTPLCLCAERAMKGKT